jgi:excinuclease UvrABC nuclease subunit
MPSPDANPLRSQLGARFFKELPCTPGVYFMLGSGGRLLYIGKAKNLNARLSTYAQFKVGKTEERLLELVAHVRAIRWEDTPTEADALKREADLLRALRPPYNRAGTDDELYLYLGVRQERTGSGRWLGFRLSNWPDFEEEGYEIFGAYRNRRLVKRSYTALLRLIHAYQCASPRFSYPAKISREAPPWIYRMKFPEELESPLREFLSGRSRQLLTRLFAGMLENENIPAFMRPSIQDDIEVVKVLYRKGPSQSRKLRLKHGLTTKLVTPLEMQKLIERDVRGTLKIV